jgi:hypothetical protein
MTGMNHIFVVYRGMPPLLLDILAFLVSSFTLSSFHPLIENQVHASSVWFQAKFQTIQRSEIYRTLGQNDSISGLFSWPLLDLRSFYRRCHKCFRGRRKYL